MIDLSQAEREYFGEDYDELMMFFYSTHSMMNDGLDWLYKSIEKTKEFLNKYPKFKKSLQDYLDDKENGWEKYEGYIYDSEEEMIKNKPSSPGDYWMPIARYNSINYITKGGSRMVITDPKIMKKLI